MFIYILLISLAFAFSFQILVIIQYVSTKSETYYRIFLGTFVINTILMIIVSIFMFKKPVYFYNLNIKFLMWVIAGLVLFVILFLKIAVTIRILKRTKDPAFYTLNYFGKKVYEKGIVRPSEFITIILSMPFFLLVGSYFVARLINMIRLGAF